MGGSQPVLTLFLLWSVKARPVAICHAHFKCLLSQNLGVPPRECLLERIVFIDLCHSCRCLWLYDTNRINLGTT